MAIAVENSITATGTASSFTINLTTGGGARVCILAVIYSSSTAISTAPTSSGLTWTLVLGQTTNLGASRLEIWKAVAAVQQTSAVITVTLPSSVAYAAILDPLSGVETTAPIDASTSTTGSAPSSANPSISVTTVADNSKVIAYLGALSTSAITAGTGYTATSDAQGTLNQLFGELKNAATHPAGSTSAPFTWAAGPAYSIAAISLAVLVNVPTTPPTLTFGTTTTVLIPIIIPALAGGATSYNLQKAADVAGSAGSYSNIQAPTTPSTTQNINTGTPDTINWFRLVAVNGAGSTNGLGASAETFAAAPTALAGTGGNGTAVLQWAAPATTTGVTYDVYQTTTPAGGSPTNPGTGLTSPSYTVTGLTNGTKYYFTVKSTNPVGQTAAASNETGIIPTGTIFFRPDINGGNIQ